MDFNRQLQRERRKERRACFDLQTMVKKSLAKEKRVSRLFVSANSFSIAATISSAGVAKPNRCLSAASSARSIPRRLHSLSIERIEIHADQHGALLLSETVGVDPVGGPGSTLRSFDRQKHCVTIFRRCRATTKTTRRKKKSRSVPRRCATRARRRSTTTTRS